MCLKKHNLYRSLDYARDDKDVEKAHRSLDKLEMTVSIVSRCHSEPAEESIG